MIVDDHVAEGEIRLDWAVMPKWRECGYWLRVSMDISAPFLGRSWFSKETTLWGLIAAFTAMAGFTTITGLVDLRPHSSSYLHWQGFELTADNRRALYIPKGFAHGLQTLAEHCEITCQISTFYARV